MSHAHLVRASVRSSYQVGGGRTFYSPELDLESAGDRVVRVEAPIVHGTTPSKKSRFLKTEVWEWHLPLCFAILLLSTQPEVLRAVAER